jgi:hypothetical protein
MKNILPKLTVRDILGYVIAYLFWLVAALIALAAMFMVRMALNVLWPAVGLNRWVLRAVDRFGLVFMGIVWLVYVIFCEQRFRSSITAARIKRTHRPSVNAAMRPIAPRAADASSDEVASSGKLMSTLARMGLDVLARRLVLSLGVPVIILALAYLVYQFSWLIVAR